MGYIGTSASVRCDGPDADLKLEAPQIWSPPGSCCYDGGDCGDSNSSKVQNKRFVLPNVAAGPEYKVRVRLPAGLSCTQEAPCTLQWTYMTGNSVDSYPEVFRNCADFKLGSANDDDHNDGSLLRNDGGLLRNDGGLLPNDGSSDCRAGQWLRRCARYRVQPLHGQQQCLLRPAEIVV